MTNILYDNQKISINKKIKTEKFLKKRWAINIYK
jgi:hypothetical protein